MKGNYYFIFLLLITSACKEGTPTDEALFHRLAPEYTGISFSNDIHENEHYNLYDYEYIYNGGGVAILDVNNDGLQDIFLSGNMVPSRLYLNKGNRGSAPLKFEDITESAGVLAENWATGVAVADINHDGYDDIYVCSAGNKEVSNTANLLYLNNKDNTFTEAAAQYGIADTLLTTQAAFFDYDRDGDLDLYLMNFGNEKWVKNFIYPKITDGSGPGADRFYKNNNDGTFTDITRKAGILVEGYGLGLSIFDINEDGWADIYVSNDYLDDDLIYVNNQDGTFTESAAQYLKHTSNFGMGNDVADINNDGLADIMVVDMLPEDNERQKVFAGAMNYDKFMLARQQGYMPAYMRNTLQLNNGMGSDGHSQGGHPTFSEIGQLAGISNTDWSWSVLFADYDNDGYKDLFVGNGYKKEITNMDFSMYISLTYVQKNEKDRFAVKGGDAQQRKKFLDLLEELRDSKIRNYFYKNNGAIPGKALTFSKKSEEWGIHESTFSNGAAYADLDNDGDLDLVVNNLNDVAFLYENQANERLGNHYLRIKLAGDSLNTTGLGAKVRIFYDDQQQVHEFSPYRGFQSTVENMIHFGLGKYEKTDSVKVTWSDGKVQLLKDVTANQIITLSYKNAVAVSQQHIADAPVFQEVSQTYGIDFTQQEEEYIDFKLEPLLPHQYSQNGPGMAVGDINGDGREDFIVGGSRNYAAKIFYQGVNEKFTQVDFNQGEIHEDMGLLLFDADNDHDLDLYAVSGGNETFAGSSDYQDRLYINDGKGNFLKDATALPRLNTSGSCVTAADYDRDGDLDLFVGGRVYPGSYPMPVASYILRNDTPTPLSSPLEKELRGVFTDVTPDLCNELQKAGMVTSALWTDFDNDGWVDLLVAGEWMPITFYKNVQGKFENVTQSTGLKNTNGWWNSLIGGDFDNDGDTDYVAGNLGLNSQYKASPEEPVCVYAKDFDASGSLDAVLCYYIMGENYPAHARDEIIDQMRYMKKKFPRYIDYARAGIQDVFSKEELATAYIVKSERFESSYIENLGNGKFSIKPLPIEAQFAPIFGLLSKDVDHDGMLDLLAVGNSYAAEIERGWYDALIGLCLKGDGKGNFEPLPAKESGFFADGDAKSLVTLTTGQGTDLVLVGQNKNQLKVFAQNRETNGKTLYLEPGDKWIEVTYQNGIHRKDELYYGTAYLSQSSRTWEVPENVKSVYVYDHAGKSRNINFSQKY